jgi:uncharacterized protein (TIGR03086 family)
MADTDLAWVHHQALERTGEIIAGITEEDWDRPDACGDWTVRELTNHLVYGNHWVQPLMSGESIESVGDRLDGDLLGEDPLQAYDASAAEADLAFSIEGAMEAPAAVSYGPVPGEIYCGHRILDVVVHGWDLAQATDQDTTIPTGLVEAVWAIIEPQLEGLQASGAFGTDHDVPADADRQTALLVALGRRPS